MHKIKDNLTQVTTRIQRAAAEAGRNSESITLLAVSKKKSQESILEAYHAGQRHFGENYLQEAVEKIEKLNKYGIQWHFVGALQSNKTRPVAEHFQWVHTIDRLKVAQRLNDQRPTHLPPLNVCIQVNIDNESSKAGIAAEEAHALATELSKLPKLRLRGLMAIPAKGDSSALAFEQLAKLSANLKKQAHLANMDTLSMGMSADLEAAVTAGSTIVRVGTAIFGERT